MAETSDRELVERTLRGEAEAYGELVERYQDSVVNVCYRFMGERQGAEDQAQEAFIRGFQRLDTFHLDKPFGPWIRRVAANQCLNTLKSSGPVQFELDEERDHATDRGRRHPERLTVRKETAASVQAAMLSLPPHYRAVIELRHYQDMSYKEIAAALNSSVGEVRTHLYRARQALAAALKEEHG